MFIFQHRKEVFLLLIIFFLTSFLPNAGAFEKKAYVYGTSDSLGHDYWVSYYFDRQAPEDWEVFIAANESIGLQNGFLTQFEYAIENNYSIFIYPRTGIYGTNVKYYPFDLTGNEEIIVIGAHASSDPLYYSNPPNLFSTITVSGGVNSVTGSYGPGLEFFDVATWDNQTKQSYTGAIVAGKIAEIINDNPTYNKWDVRQHLRQISSFYGTGGNWTEQGGYGRPNLSMSISSLDLGPPYEINYDINDSGDITFTWDRFNQTRESGVRVYRLGNSTPIYEGESENFTYSFPGYGNYTFYLNSYDSDTGDVSPNETYTVLSINLSDSSPPSIQYVFPTQENNSFFSGNVDSFEVNVTSSDFSGISNINLSLFFTNHTLINSTSSSSSPFYLNFTGLQEGSYYFNATSTDLDGNNASLETRVVYFDSSKPFIDTLLNVSSSRNYILVNFSCTDSVSGISSCSVYGNAGFSNQETGIISNLSCGTDYNISISSIDNSGNSNSTSSIFSTTSCNSFVNDNSVLLLESGVWKDLTDSAYLNWTDNFEVNSLAFYSNNNLTFTGLSQGKFGVYNRTSNNWTDLSNTDTSGWSDDSIFFNGIAIDINRSLVYTGLSERAGFENDRVFGVYNITSNVWTDLSTTDSGNWANNIAVNSISIDQNLGLAYTGLVGGFSTSGSFGVYNITSNVWTNLGSIGGWGDASHFRAVSVHPQNGWVYTGVSEWFGGGKFGFYNLQGNNWTDLSDTDTGDWAGSDQVILIGIDSNLSLVYTALDSLLGDGKFGVYNITSNVWTDLSSLDEEGWLTGSQISSLSVDQNLGLVYTGFENGILGVYNQSSNTWYDFSNLDPGNWAYNSEIKAIAVSSDNLAYTGLQDGKLGVYNAGIDNPVIEESDSGSGSGSGGGGGGGSPKQTSNRTIIEDENFDSQKFPNIKIISPKNETYFFNKINFSFYDENNLIQYWKYKLNNGDYIIPKNKSFFVDASDGENVLILYGKKFSNSPEENVSIHFSIKEDNYCGDLVCDPILDENFFSCSEDCNFKAKNFEFIKGFTYFFNPVFSFLEFYDLFSKDPKFSFFSEGKNNSFNWILTKFKN